MLSLFSGNLSSSISNQIPIIYFYRQKLSTKSIKCKLQFKYYCYEANVLSNKHQKDLLASCVTNLDGLCNLTKNSFQKIIDCGVFFVRLEKSV